MAESVRCAPSRPVNPVATTAQKSSAAAPKQPSYDDPVVMAHFLVDMKLQRVLQRFLDGLVSAKRERHGETVTREPTRQSIQRHLDQVQRVLDQIDAQFNTMIEIERQNKLLEKAVPYNVVDDETAANAPQQQTLDRRQTIGVTQMIQNLESQLRSIEALSDDFSTAANAIDGKQPQEMMEE